MKKLYKKIIVMALTATMLPSAKPVTLLLKKSFPTEKTCEKLLKEAFSFSTYCKQFFNEIITLKNINTVRFNQELRFIDKADARLRGIFFSKLIERLQHIITPGNKEKIKKLFKNLPGESHIKWAMRFIYMKQFNAEAGSDSYRKIFFTIYDKLENSPKKLDLTKSDQPKQLLVFLNYIEIIEPLYKCRLKKLILDQNQITIIPKTICNLIHLKELSFHHCGIKSPPKEISNLIDLEILFLSDNKIEKVPLAIYNMKNLKELYLTANTIEKIHKNIGSLTKLEVFCLSNNNIEDLPHEIYNLKNLRTFSIARNRIKKIDEKIGSLTNLQVLDFSYNFITSIPESVCKLSNLNFIDLRKNKLSEIPKKLLKTLKKCDVDYKKNPIKKDRCLIS